jgi:hypothetical protein
MNNRQTDATGPTTNNITATSRSYGKPVAPAAVDRLLMMGIGMPETCSVVSKRQAIDLLLIAASGWLIYLNTNRRLINHNKPT